MCMLQPLAASSMMPGAPSDRPQIGSLLPSRTLISLPLTGTLPDGWAAPGALQALEVLFINFNEIAGELLRTACCEVLETSLVFHGLARLSLTDCPTLHTVRQALCQQHGQREERFPA